jgi:modulator of FtsH protease HflK
LPIASFNGSSLSNSKSALRRRWWIVAFAIYVLSGVYLVPPDQQAVVLRFGRVVEKRMLPGIHYHLPFPVESVIKLKALETKRLAVGIEMPDKVLGRGGLDNRALYLTGDQNLINVQVSVQFSVKEPADYLFNSRDVSRLVSQAVESAFAATIAGEGVDSLLTTGKVAVQNATQQLSQEMLDSYSTGVSISSVNIESVSPPAGAADAFREVASARADRDRIVNEAYGYANDVVAKSRGEADKSISDAESYRERRVNEAQGESERFTKLVEAYSQAKQVTEKRLYLEAMEEVLPRIKKVIIDSTGSKNLMDLGIIRPSQ